jgi:hypothetical protein
MEDYFRGSTRLVSGSAFRRLRGHKGTSGLLNLPSSQEPSWISKLSRFCYCFATTPQRFEVVWTPRKVWVFRQIEKAS